MPETVFISRIKNEDQDRRIRETQHLIEQICGEPHLHNTKRPVTYAELATALELSVYLTKTGGTRSLVSRWAKGQSIPAPEHLAVLRAINDGEAAIQLYGARVDVNGVSRRIAIIVPTASSLRKWVICDGVANVVTQLFGKVRPTKNGFEVQKTNQCEGFRAIGERIDGLYVDDQGVEYDNMYELLIAKYAEMLVNNFVDNSKRT